ncbi:MAG: HypC/HybG/HupF family hydrogenase formation chaperone [Actinomycetota bacterium]|nr:HypC/HybG/HupF family hydrogenase formation chaperone [Actinomycetota bacterium]
MCMGIPGRVVEVLPDHPHLAMVEVGGAKRQVNVGLLEPKGVRPGEWVDVHTGFAVSVLDETEAKESLALLEEFERALEYDPGA